MVSGLSQIVSLLPLTIILESMMDFDSIRFQNNPLNASERVILIREKSAHARARAQSSCERSSGGRNGLPEILSPSAGVRTLSEFTIRQNELSED